MYSIDQSDRDDLLPHCHREAMTRAELEFQVAVLADGYLAGNATGEALHEVLAALEGAKLEIHRRFAGAIADDQIRVCGDLFEAKVRPIGRLSAPPSVQPAVSL